MENIKLVSACLLGVECRYDGQAKPCQKVIESYKECVLIPVCPEQLGGLSTPRDQAEQQKDGKVLTKNGKDVSENFQKGVAGTPKIRHIVRSRDNLKSKTYAKRLSFAN